MGAFSQTDFYFASEQLVQTQKYRPPFCIHHPLFFALVGLLAFVSLALPAARQHLLPGDALVYGIIQEAHSPLLTSFFRIVTKASSFKVLVPVGVGQVVSGMWWKSEKGVIIRSS